MRFDQVLPNLVQIGRVVVSGGVCFAELRLNSVGVGRILVVFE